MAKEIDVNDPVVQIQRAGSRLRRLECAQKNSFERWATAWKNKRAHVLAEMSDDAFRMLRAGNVATAKDEQIRNEMIKAREAQESGEAVEVEVEE